MCSSDRRRTLQRCARFSGGTAHAMTQRTIRLPRLLAVALAAGLTMLVSLADADARVSCGTETALSSGQIFRIVAGGVGCTTAKAVAGGWFNVQSQGKSGRTVFDQRQKRWSCRVTERATGTDPGFIPFTSVRCTRGSAVVRFKLRS
jgi:hypothetical protein